MLVLEETLVAAAVQRMRGLPEPVGLGTERQHMFMASFLPPLPPLFCLDNPLVTPFSRSLSFRTRSCTCGRLRSKAIKVFKSQELPSLPRFF